MTALGFILFQCAAAMLAPKAQIAKSNYPATTLSGTMKGKRRISQKKSTLLEVVAEIRRISEFLGEEA